MKKLYFTAGEPSGDIFAAEVIDALRALAPDSVFRAVGGSQLAARCETPEIDVTPLNVLGYWEGIKAYGDVKRISRAIADDIVRFKPDAAVLVDAWGLSLRVAKQVRAQDASIKLIKLIGPQVWASRAGRAKTLAKTVDALLCMHEFEAPYYEPYGLPITVIGQPALARAERIDGAEFRAHYGIAPQDPLLLVLPGSRRAEIERVAPPLIAAARKLSDEHAGLKVCVAPSEGVLAGFKRQFPRLPKDWMLLEDASQKYEAMAAATLALSCSGTVNTELAVQGTPFITGYRIGRISWTLLKLFFFRAKFITLLNMAADRMVAREFLQGEMSAENLAGEAKRLLEDPAALDLQRQAQDEALVAMGYGKPSAQSVSAKAILDTLSEV